MTICNSFCLKKVEFFSNKKFRNYLNNVEVTFKKVLKSYFIIQVGFQYYNFLNHHQ